MIYADTSFLVSLYIDEEQTETVRKYTAKAEAGLAFTPFHRLELRTALRLRIFRRELSQNSLKRLFQLIDNDLQEGTLQHLSLNWNDTMREAEEIADTHLIQVGARSGDLLHVASAVVLGATEFCTFDQRQTELAKRAGLKVKTWR